MSDPANSIAITGGPGARVPLIELSDGAHVPQLGFGVWQVSNDEVTPVVVAAIEAGYRSIDTARGYDNEEGVGVAIRRPDSIAMNCSSRASFEPNPWVTTQRSGVCRNRSTSWGSTTWTCF